MNEIIVNESTGDLQQYTPAESIDLQNQAEAALDYYKRVKDTAGIEKAVKAIWTERYNFVRWWDASRLKGRPSEDEKLDRSVNLSDFGLAPKVVSRWRQKCGDEISLQLIIKTQSEKAKKIVDPAATADKHTGDEESYTPEKYIESSRLVMGSIDLDPASNTMAQETVKAGKYYTVEDDGLSFNWQDNVWLNPPYTARVINEFVDKLTTDYESGDINQAIMLTNNNTDTLWFHQAALVSSAICFTAGRINFLKRDGSRSSPTNGQAFFYFGDNVEGFKQEFSKHGYVMVRA